MLNITCQRKGEIVFTFIDSNGTTTNVVQRINKVDNRGNVKIGIDAPKSVKILNAGKASKQPAL